MMGIPILAGVAMWRDRGTEYGGVQTGSGRVSVGEQRRRAVAKAGDRIRTDDIHVGNVSESRMSTTQYSESARFARIASEIVSACVSDNL